jgi:hypothetical protein
MKKSEMALALGFNSGVVMVSSSSQSVRGTSAFSQLRTHIQQSVQDWIRREIIDDDPYDSPMLEETSETLP